MGPVSRFQELGPRLTWLRVVQEAAVAEVVRRLQQGGVGGAEAQGRGQGGHQRSLPRPHVTRCHRLSLVSLGVTPGHGAW